MYEITCLRSFAFIYALVAKVFCRYTISLLNTSAIYPKKVFEVLPITVKSRVIYGKSKVKEILVELGTYTYPYLASFSFLAHSWHGFSRKKFATAVSHTCIILDILFNIFDLALCFQPDVSGSKCTKLCKCFPDNALPSCYFAKSRCKLSKNSSGAFFVVSSPMCYRIFSYTLFAEKQKRIFFYFR